MKNYCALVVNDVVVEIIVAEFDWVQQNLEGQWHDLGPEPLTVAIGYSYDAATNSFNAPTTPKEFE